MKLKSPVSRIGGKYFLRNWLTEFIPSHKLYCEPFCGAGHLLFSKHPSKVEVLNDIDHHLITFFQVLQDKEKRQELIDRLNYFPFSRHLWQVIRNRWKAGNFPISDIEMAIEWFFLNSTCFSGDFQNGGFRLPSVTGRNPAQTFRNTIGRLDEIAFRLRYVTIENLDFEDCIRKYDNKDTFFFCDPPYLLENESRAKRYYSQNFTQDDHQRLAGILSGVKGAVLVPHYENDLYDELYKGWNRYEYQSFKVSRGLTVNNPAIERPKTKEILYTNY